MMQSMNRKMEAMYGDLSIKTGELNFHLSNICDHGFLYENDCYFLSTCFDVETNISISNFPDKTGYECFVNTLNVEDYVDGEYLKQALLFVKKLFFSWNGMEFNKELVAIFISNEYGMKLKFHVNRPSENWLSDDLEGYDEPILVIDSSGHFSL